MPPKKTEIPQQKPKKVEGNDHSVLAVEGQKQTASDNKDQTPKTPVQKPSEIDEDYDEDYDDDYDEDEEELSEEFMREYEKEADKRFRETHDWWY